MIDSNRCSDQCAMRERLSVVGREAGRGKEGGGGEGGDGDGNGGVLAFKMLGM